MGDEVDSKADLGAEEFEEDGFAEEEFEDGGDDGTQGVPAETAGPEAETMMASGADDEELGPMESASQIDMVAEEDVEAGEEEDALGALPENDGGTEAREDNWDMQSVRTANAINTIRGDGREATENEAQEMRAAYLEIIKADDSEEKCKELAKQIVISDYDEDVEVAEAQTLNFECWGDNDVRWSKPHDFDGPDACASFGRMPWCSHAFNKHSLRQSRLHFLIMRVADGTYLAIDLGSRYGITLLPGPPDQWDFFQPESISRKPIEFKFTDDDAGEKWIWAGKKALRISLEEVE